MTDTLTAGLRALPRPDKTLLTVLSALALLALGAGLVFGTLTGLARAGALDLFPETAYRLLTLHGVTIFFYWLSFAQAALLLALAAAYAGGGGGLRWSGLAWAGLGLMIGGLVLSGAGSFAGPALLYDGPPELAMAPSPETGFFYVGYLMLAAGLFLVAATAIATALAPKAEGAVGSWPAIGFAAVAWAGLLMVSAAAAVNVFLPAAGWAAAGQPLPADHATAWHLLFHNMHYLPLMATVVVWYALIETLTGVKSVFGPRFSKIIFASYLIFVPPTSLYHMFLEPGLAEAVRTVGSLLSLFISVPTVAVFLVIVASLEVHARAQGARGLFGWLRLLPWGHPAMAAIGWAVVNLALGGVFAFVLIQEKLAPLLSDTFFVPGYFHFLTVGTVTLTLLAAFTVVLPALTGRRLIAPRLLTRLPALTTLGLLLFGGAGIAAGIMGVPRRVFDIVYGGMAPPAWGVLLGVMGVGAILMAIGTLTYVAVLAGSLLPGRRGHEGRPLPVVAWGGTGAAAAAGRYGAWVGPLSVAVLIGTMYLFTIIAFEVMRSLPVLATGGAAH